MRPSCPLPPLRAPTAGPPDDSAGLQAACQAALAAAARDLATRPLPRPGSAGGEVLAALGEPPRWRGTRFEGRTAGYAALVSVLCQETQEWRRAHDVHPLLPWRAQRARGRPGLARR